MGAEGKGIHGGEIVKEKAYYMKYMIILLHTVSGYLKMEI